MDGRVEFEDCGVDAVEDESGGGGADSQADEEGCRLVGCGGWEVGRGVDEKDGFELCEDGVDGFGD